MKNGSTDQNLDAMVSERLMHLILSKFYQNFNQKLYELIKTIIKRRNNRSKAVCNLDTEFEMLLITSKLDQNINQKQDQEIKT